jgi:hypothetical protein
MHLASTADIADEAMKAHRLCSDCNQPACETVKHWLSEKARWAAHDTGRLLQPRQLAQHGS